MSGAGYSRKPLIEKLGIRPGDHIAFIGAPSRYHKILGPLPKGVKIANANPRNLDFVHIFVRSRSVLRDRLPGVRTRIKPTGMIWVSWPKRASGVSTDVTEGAVRAAALDVGARRREGGGD